MENIEIVQFIDAVRQREILWNLSHPHYKNIRMKAKEWKLIAGTFDLPIDVVKKKWKSIRDSYARNVNKMKISGLGADEMDPTGKYCDSMEFLKEHLKHRLPFGSYAHASPQPGEEISTDTPTNDSGKFKSSPPLSPPEFEDFMCETHTNSQYASTESLHMEDLLLPSTSTSASAVKRRKTSTMEDAEIEKIIEAVRNREILWNLSYPNYKNIRMKSKEWKQIANELDLPIHVLKQKWKGLRDTYARNLNKQKISGQCSDEMDPSGKYSDSLEFLKGHLKHRLPFIRNAQASPHPVEKRCKNRSSSPSTSTDSLLIEDDGPTTSANAAKTRKMTTLTFLRTMESVQDYLNRPPEAAVVPSHLPPVTNSEEYFFCLSIHHKLVSFPIELRNEAKIEMMRYLNGLQADHLQSQRDAK